METVSRLGLSPRWIHCRESVRGLRRAEPSDGDVASAQSRARGGWSRRRASGGPGMRPGGGGAASRRVSGARVRAGGVLEQAIVRPQRPTFMPRGGCGRAAHERFLHGRSHWPFSPVVDASPGTGPCRRRQRKSNLWLHISRPPATSEPPNGVGIARARSSASTSPAACTRSRSTACSVWSSGYLGERHQNGTCKDQRHSSLHSGSTTSDAFPSFAVQRSVACQSDGCRLGAAWSGRHFRARDPRG